jgi:hypothetical protein
MLLLLMPVLLCAGYVTTAAALRRRSGGCSCGGSCRPPQALLRLPELLLQQLHLSLLLSKLLCRCRRSCSHLLPQSRCLSLYLLPPLCVRCLPLSGIRRRRPRRRSCLLGSAKRGGGCCCRLLGLLSCNHGRRQLLSCDAQLQPQLCLSFSRRRLRRRLARCHRLDLPEQRPCRIPGPALQRLGGAFCLPQPLLQVCCFAPKLYLSVSPVCGSRRAGRGGSGR